MGIKKKLFLFDIDGTLMIGDVLFPETKALLKRIEEVGGKSYFLTNNSTLSIQEYVEKFKRLGIQAQPEQFVTAGSVTIDYLKQYYANKRLFVVATQAYRSEMKAAGLKVIEEDAPDTACVVVAYDNELTYQKLEIACRLLQQDKVDFIATNLDKRCPGPQGFLPDCGAICDLISAVVARTPLYLGKPNDTMIRRCLQATGFKPEETIIIGDRLYTDIKAGKQAGIETCAVLTGETSLEEIRTSHIKPTYCLKDLSKVIMGFVS